MSSFRAPDASPVPTRRISLRRRIPLRSSTKKDENRATSQLSQPVLSTDDAEMLLQERERARKQRVEVELIQSLFSSLLELHLFF